MPALKEIKDWWDSPAGKKMLDEKKVWFDTILPVAFGVYRVAWSAMITGPGGAFAELYDTWKGQKGKSIFASLDKWMRTDLPEGITAFQTSWGIGPGIDEINTRFGTFLGAKGKELFDWLVNVEIAGRALGDFLSGR